MEKEPQAFSPIKAIHFATYHLKEPLERTRDPTWRRLAKPHHREEHLLATPEEEIDPELIEFVKRDQFHDLFSEYALEHIDHFDNLCDSYGVFDFEKKMMLFSTSLAGPALDWAQHEPLSTIESWIDFREAFLKRFARLPPFKSNLNEELIKHVERNPFYNSTSECAKEHLCNFEQLCHDYGLGDNPKKIQLFQLSLAGQAKEWAKFNAQHAFKTWNGYKGAFLHRFAKGPIYVPPPRPSYSQHHPSSPDINKTPLFPRESYQAARQTKIEEMLQEYLRNQDESTKKMERESISSMRALETNLKSYSSK
ncbi:unnamed protein product [Microthlaspi erraticum]|uniref:Retrotransposon gag domain-containing protein n=1 Tax=Microthlaspi erraticum TaxID=1685480 RepID=A0A6D2KKW1_9BRAS|nr:unnamed protein product [Microthlaspi erraticum]